MATPNLGIDEVAQSSSQKVVVINQGLVDLDNAGNAVGAIDTAAGGTIAVLAAVFNRAVVLQLTGAPVAAFTIEVPANARLFAVDNQSGQEATVQVTGGGGVAATVADGAQVLLHSDATDIKAYGGGSSGGGGAVEAQDEGIQVVAAATAFNFIGDAVSVSDAGSGVADVTITGGGASGNQAFGPTLKTRMGLSSNFSVSGTSQQQIPFNNVEFDDAGLYPGSGSVLEIPAAYNGMRIRLTAFVRETTPSSSSTQLVIYRTRSMVDTNLVLSARDTSLITNNTAVSEWTEVQTGDQFGVDISPDSGDVLDASLCYLVAEIEDPGAVVSVAEFLPKVVSYGIPGGAAASATRATRGNALDIQKDIVVQAVSFGLAADGSATYTAHLLDLNSTTYQIDAVLGSSSTADVPAPTSITGSVRFLFDNVVVPSGTTLGVVVTRTDGTDTSVCETIEMNRVTEGYFLPTNFGDDDMQYVQSVVYQTNAPAATQTVTASGNSTVVATRIEYTDSELISGQSFEVTSDAATAYTPVLADRNGYKRLDNASAIAVTIPTDASVPFPVGTVLTYEQAGTGAITVSGDTGVTVNARGSLTTSAGQFAVLALTKVAADEWTLTGDVT